MVNAYGTIPYGMGAAIIGNRMEIIKTDDGLQYLYIMRHSAQERCGELYFFLICKHYKCQGIITEVDLDLTDNSKV
jgi:hypothetical protein